MQLCTPVRACMVVMFAFIPGVFEPASPCNTKLPPMGPRLLHAKALFGEAMRECGKETLEYFKNVPPHLLHKILPISCAVYNECRPLSQVKLKPVFDCCISAYRNKTAPFYTRLNLSDAYGQSAENALVCVLKGAESRGIGLQALDDAIAFGRKTALTFGWT